MDDEIELRRDRLEGRAYETAGMPLGEPPQTPHVSSLDTPLSHAAKLRRALVAPAAVALAGAILAGPRCRVCSRCLAADAHELPLAARYLMMPTGRPGSSHCPVNWITNRVARRHIWWYNANRYGLVNWNEIRDWTRPIWTVT
jgi:hypothetical protein